MLRPPLLRDRTHLLRRRMLLMEALLRDATAKDQEAVLGLLASHEHLEVAFEPREFVVALNGGDLVGCARLRPLLAGSELASVAVAHHDHRKGVGSALVRAALRKARHGPVYALALAPGFFAKHGFKEIPTRALPPQLQEKANGLCQSTGFVAMARVPP